MSNDEFEVGTSGELRANYGLTAANRPTVRLDPSRVPPSLRHMIPLAERFGISDDLIRDDVLAAATAEEREALRLAVEPHDDAFDAWLAGPEADGPRYSAEYIAFTCLRMAADCC